MKAAHDPPSNITGKLHGAVNSLIRSIKIMVFFHMEDIVSR